MEANKTEPATGAAIRTNTDLYWCALTKPTKTGNRVIKLLDYHYSVRPIQMIQIPFGAARDKFENFALFKFFHLNVRTSLVILN